MSLYEEDRCSLQASCFLDLAPLPRPLWLSRGIGSSQNGELAPRHGSHAVASVIIHHPSGWMGFGWCYATWDDVAELLCHLVYC